MVYGYCRVSTKHQRIARQITNIKQVDLNAIIVKEYYLNLKTRHIDSAEKKEKRTEAKHINILKKMKIN